MRLIDKDKLPHYNGTALSAVEVARAVDDAPTIEERKKGKWNFIGNNMHECTNCKRAYTVQQFEAMRNYNRDPLNPKFCPNCGADMREEKDNAKIH